MWQLWEQAAKHDVVRQQKTTWCGYRRHIREMWGVARAPGTCWVVSLCWRGMPPKATTFVQSKMLTNDTSKRYTLSGFFRFRRPCVERWLLNGAWLQVVRQMCYCGCWTHRQWRTLHAILPVVQMACQQRLVLACHFSSCHLQSGDHF